MDEPFRGLDTALKSKLTKLFLKLLSKDNKTVIFITHDITEAVLLADKIVVFGNRPIEIKGEIAITVPHEERALSNEIVSSSADKLLKLLEN
jgi:NitT/TauT family transport system ATP-binding protein